jgi:hypothetical protein
VTAAHEEVDMSLRRSIGTALVAWLALSVAGPPAWAAPTTVALWHMDEGSGTTAIDATGNGHNGTNTNIGYVSPGFDGSGGAYSFNGSSRVVIPDSPALNPGSQDITLVAHVKTTTLPGSVGDYDLIRKKKNAQVYKMEILGTGVGYCQFKGTVASVAVKGGPNIVNGQWHTIVCAKTSSQVTLTVDGTVVATKVRTAGSISPPIDLYLGRQPDGSDAYTGLMDEVSVTIG